MGFLYFCPLNQVFMIYLQGQVDFQRTYVPSQTTKFCPFSSEGREELS